MNKTEINFNRIRDYIKKESELSFSELPNDFTNQDNIDWISEMISILSEIKNEILA